MLGDRLGFEHDVAGDGVRACRRRRDRSAARAPGGAVRLAGSPTGDQMIRGDGLERRPRLDTAWLGERAAWREAAAGWHVGEVGRLALDRRQRLAPASERGQAVQQADRVGMARQVEHVAHGPRLDDAAGVHDGHAIAELGHDAEVVGDEHHGQARLALDVLQQPQVLGLDRHVERRRRLVGDE